MAQRSVRSEILALSIPAIASNITTPLLGLADVAVVGHIGSAVYISRHCAGRGGDEYAVLGVLVP